MPLRLIVRMRLLNAPMVKLYGRISASMFYISVNELEVGSIAS